MSDSNEDVCPVCGQEYVHKRERSSEESYDLRDDYVQCRRYDTFGVNASDTVWVHEAEQTVNTNTTVVEHVDRDRTFGGINLPDIRQPMMLDEAGTSIGSGTSGSGIGGELRDIQQGDLDE